jgi:hypothetical protein
VIDFGTGNVTYSQGNGGPGGVGYGGNGGSIYEQTGGSGSTGRVMIRYRIA